MMLRSVLDTHFAVLVVDDSPQMRAVGVELFEDLGFRVYDAWNGESALRLLEAHPEIGLIFVDIRMPGMSGLDLARAAQEMRPDLKVVLTSGYVDARVAPPDVPFLAKPWRLHDVTEAVIAVTTTGRDSGEPTSAH